MPDDTSARRTLETSPGPASGAWSVWKRVGFRFLFVYLLLQSHPWTWLAYLPGLGWSWVAWSGAVDAAVQWSNARVFHVAETLVPLNGSWDTSWAWAQLRLYLSLAAIACVVWSILDRKRAAYDRLAYWLRTVVRYWIAAAALSYGISKIFALQMPFPSPSQLATPVGDLLPMRLLWLSVGYSTKYQVFSGLIEFSAGVLLLYRRTLTVGLLAAAAAFANVVMLDLGYDIPVKLYATHLLLASVWLLAWDARRLFAFLFLNRPAAGTALYEPPFHARWQRTAARVVKLVLVLVILGRPLTLSWSSWRRNATTEASSPFPRGVYDVNAFVVNGDTVPPTAPVDTRWRDVIFDDARSGSVGTSDTLFWQRYGRGYFRFRADTVARTADVWRSSFAAENVSLFQLRYERPDTATIRMWMTIRGDSVYVELIRSDRFFPLVDRPFHWLSEYPW